MIDRREAIRRISVVLGGVVSTPTLAALLSGCEAPRGDRVFAARTLDDGGLRTVELIAEAIIPQTDTPGASAARVHEFVDMMLTDFYTEEARRRFLDRLAELDGRALALYDRSFAEARSEERAELLDVLDAEAYPDPDGDPAAAADVDRRVAEGEPPFMRTMKELVVAGYYTSEIGQTVELHTPPFGSYEADVPLEAIGRSWA